MTKQEILEYFKDINHAYNESTRYDDLKRMLDELTEPCEDCISRKEAIKAMEDKAKGLKNLDTINGLCGAVAILYDLPSVQPIRPKGEWISHTKHCKSLGVLPSGLGMYCWCSKCDTGIDIIQFSRVEYNFCPYCGADMRGAE